jgi:hypothetical protein
MTLSWQVFNLGESFMQSAINQAETSLLHHFPNSTISYQAHPNYVTYSVSLYPTNLLQTEECQNYLKNNFIPEVQKSFGENIKMLDFIQSEVNVEELYEGCCLIDELDNYLNSYGFKRIVTAMWDDGAVGWGDALYIKK